MKIIPISTTQFDWPALLKELPNEIVTSLNVAGVNLQSCNGFVRLMSAYESYADNTTHKLIADYILKHWSMGCYFEMPYYWIDEFRKLDLYVLSIPKGRDTSSGIISGTVRQWKESYTVCIQLNESEFFQRMSKMIETLFAHWQIKPLLGVGYAVG